ncbi:MAG TPA: asparagine synthase (glutamine-hydrolyzing) [Bacteroidetes bacterium]|nr:asparagine synthase (glutamine-hydrolyzing) [Bacteroidota bacterium]
MCGIAGVFKLDDNKATKEEIKTLTDLLIHRGPDGEGVYCEGSVGLGHRRLSIIDLTDDGKQPMLFDEKYVITFNGEIYNYLEVKKELIKKGYNFKSKTDTEVILAAYDYYGEECLKHFNGMWAFVIYDKVKNILFCSRDRFGVKPFYYSVNNNQFIFSSEIKPILSTFSSVKVDKGILMEYLIMNMTDHTERTFFEGIKTLRGSHNLIINLRTKEMSIKPYYSIKHSPEIAKLNEEDSIDLFEKEFKRSIEWRLRSDVKVGTCLSGGLDSSYIAAVASKMYKHNDDVKFNAITAESLDPALNETAYAKIVVDHLNLDWHVTSPTAKDFNEGVQDLVRTQEEPFGTPSVFLQNLVMKKAKESGVTVLLDGQGADETILGYPRYIGAYLKTLPFYKRPFVLKSMSTNYGLPLIELIKNQFYFTSYQIKKKRVLMRLGKVNQDFMDALDFSTLKDLSKAYGNLSMLQQMEVMKTQIPQLLKWEDKNSMAYSVETRLPFLDYKLVETNLSINNSFKLNNLWSKYVLRKAMEKVLPASIVYRKKKIGFTAPAKDWLHNSAIWDVVVKSPMLNEIFNNNIKKPNDINLFWRVCNIALWEKEFEVKY